MDKKELTQIVRGMIAAPSCCQGLKTGGENWLNAVGSNEKKAAAETLFTGNPGRRMHD